jgi:acyl-coenzyme A synthetase/AMP-(fatty) acid ligase/3-hydroxymyristoyl/3-hydroxydecanoyl-(acyl carrier protein) dehydratase
MVETAWPLAEIASRKGSDERAIAWRNGQAIDRAEFLRAVGRWQRTFEAVTGERVALYIDDSFDFAAALYGAWHAGKRVIVPGDKQPGTVQRLQAMADVLAGDLPQGVRAAITPSATARMPLDRYNTRLVLFTSGSGGEPVAIDKALMQLDAEIAMHHALFGEDWAANAELRVHATVSHHHIYGLLFTLLWPLAAGRRFAVERLAYPEEMAARLGQTPSLLVASPAHLKRLPEQLDWHGARAQLRAVLSSGGPLPSEAALRAAACFGDAPIEIYGSSETGGIAWRQRTRDGDMWRALQNVQWRINADGLLEVSSPHLPNKDWWTTADLAQGTDDARFVLRGREDRIAKIEETRVSLSAIERTLLATPWVAEVRALVVPAGPGERVGVVYMPSNEGHALLHAEGWRALHLKLRAVLASQIAPVALPRRWRCVDAMPVDTQGKTREAALRALFEADGVPAITWMENSLAQAVGRLRPPASHPAFDGHFPGVPILPGVVQLQWAVETARRCFAVEASVRGLEVLKFQQVIRPETDLTLTLRWNSEERRLQFHYESAAGAHASGRVLFSPQV